MEMVFWILMTSSRNDPDEQSDADGDGVGDNADFAPSVSNDVVYSAGAVMLLVLFGVLVSDCTWQFKRS